MRAPKPKDVHETQALEQCKLNLGYAFESENEPAAKLFNMVFGGYFMSKLSKVVREKMSLCYYCSSAAGLFKKVIIVACGVESENRGKAVEEIHRQLESIQNGKISPEELELAKKKLKEGYLSLETPADISRWYLSQMLKPLLKTPQQAWEEVEKVSASEVTEFAKTVQSDTVYSLGEAI